MTFRDAVRSATQLSPGDKVLALLGYIAVASRMAFEQADGPVIDLKDGRQVEFDTWEQWDEAERRGWVEVSKDQGSVGLTWAGQKALNNWQRKGGRTA